MLASRFREYFEELPRRVYLVAFATGLLIVVAAAVGAFGLASMRSDSKAIQTLSGRGDLLAAVVSTTAQNQLDITVLSEQPFNAAGLATFTGLHQGLVDDWKHYEDVAYGDAAPPPTAAAVSAQIDQETRTLQQGAVTKATQSTTALREGAAAQITSLASIAGDLAILQTGQRVAEAAAVSAQNADSSFFTYGLLATAALAFLTVGLGNTSIARGGRRFEKAAKTRESDLDEAVRSNEFEARLQRALDLSATESRIYGVVRRALVEALPDKDVELLQADSSRAHFEQLVTTGDMSRRRCSVQSPQDCPAAQRGAVLAFVSSQAIDACPYLQEQAEPCSAVCVPVSVAGATVGVMHAAGEHGKPLDHHQRNTLELVARRSSDRLGMLRAFARSEVQANTDPLTGLRNRRSLEDEVSRLALTNTRYAVAFGDLDRFKMLNDVHGHAAGDQALRLFAQVLRGALRPNDLVARYGGEEFVIVLPDCSEAEAVVVLDRVRDHLATAVSEFGGPHFTVSFGLAAGRHEETFTSVVSTADAALLDAKARGRDRVAIAAAKAAGSGDSRSANGTDSRSNELEAPTQVRL